MQGLVNFKICIGILLFGVVSLGPCRNIHEDMTSDELIRTFYEDKNIPDYEVTYIEVSYKNKRDVASQLEMRFNIFGYHMMLYLEPFDGFLFTNETNFYDMYTDVNNPNRYILLNSANSILNGNPKLYRNESLSSFVALSNGKISWGYIGSENLVIRPVPERLVKDAKRYARSAGNVNKPELKDYSYHIVYKKNTSRIMERFVNSEKTKRETDYIIYPQVLVIVENSYFNLFYRNIEDFIIYSMAFWNGVDMLFRSIENPKIRLNIAGIIIARDDNVLQYMKDSYDLYGKFNINCAIEKSASWLYDFVYGIIDKDKYDVVVTLAKHGREVAGIRETRGIAFQSSACKVDHSCKRVYKSAIVTDNGGFDGIKFTAHELGHTFGATHDGENGCVDDGQMMAPLSQRTRNAVNWSPCTLSEFGNFFISKRECLSNIPKGISLSRVLPGKLQDANEQCLRKTGGPVLEINDEICYQLSCIVPKEVIGINGERSQSIKNILLTNGAADGTNCGPNKICLHGQCVFESSITGYFSA